MGDVEGMHVRGVALATVSPAKNKTETKTSGKKNWRNMDTTCFCSLSNDLFVVYVPDTINAAVITFYYL